MSKDWTIEELEQASKTMMTKGQMGCKEFYYNLVNRMFDLESTKLAVKPTEL